MDDSDAAAEADAGMGFICDSMSVLNMFWIASRLLILELILGSVIDGAVR